MIDEINQHLVAKLWPKSPIPQFAILQNCPATSGSPLVVYDLLVDDVRSYDDWRSWWVRQCSRIIFAPTEKTIERAK